MKFFSGTTEKTIGCCCILLTAWGFSFVNVLTRLMQKTPFAILMFYYSIIGFSITLCILMVEAAIKEQPLRIFKYDFQQYGITIIASFINFATIASQTIAMQNDKPGFVTLLGYIGIVYAFMGDTFIFHETFNGMELLGVGIVLSMNLLLIYKKMKNPKITNWTK